MHFTGDQKPAVDSCRKRRRRDGLSVAEALHVLTENSESREGRKAPAKGPKKGCMKGKGGPQNQNFNFRGVRQRISGTWVAEIRPPKGGKRLWLGTFPTAIDAAMAYDEAAMKLHGEKAILNRPHVLDSNSVAGSSVSNVSAAGAVSESGDEFMKVTDDTLAGGLSLGDSPMDVRGSNDIKAEAEENKDTEPGEGMKAEAEENKYTEPGEDMKAEAEENKETETGEGMKAEAEQHKETEPGEDVQAEAEENRETEQGREECMEEIAYSSPLDGLYSFDNDKWTDMYEPQG